jgi:hypothetical protein
MYSQQGIEAGKGEEIDDREEEMEWTIHKWIDENLDLIEKDGFRWLRYIIYSRLTDFDIFSTMK